MKKYEILLAQPPDVSSRGLVTAAKIVWVWASLAAGEQLLEKPPHSHSVPDCNWNSNNLDASKKVRATDNKSDSNVKAGVKQLQKYVKKSYITSSFASNQTQVEQVDGVSEDSTGSTASELDRSSVSSSSSSEPIEGTKVDQSSLLGIPTLSQSSAQKPEVSAHLHQMEISQGLVLGEEPSISTECASRNGTLDGVSSNGHYHQIYQQSKSSKAYTGEKIEKGGNESKVKPLQKYVKKITTACSSSKQVDSIRTYDCSVSSTRSEVHLSSVLSSSSSKSVEATKVGYAGPPGTSTLFQSSAKIPTASVHLHQVRAPQKSILGKKPSTSTGYTSRNGNNHGLGVSLGNCHPTYQQQSKSSQAQSKLHSNKLHSNCKVGDHNGKSGNQYKVKQHQEYVRKTDTSSSFASNEICLGFSGNSKGSFLGQPSQPMSSLSCSESLDGTKINPLSSLSSAQKPATPTHLHREGAEFIFGNKPSTSIECMQKNETLCFVVIGGHYDPTYQQTQSSMLLKQDKSSPPNRHSGFDQSYSTNFVIGSSAFPSAGHNGVASSQLQTWSGGSVFQGLADICLDMSRLPISECPTRLPSQGVPANYSSFSMSNVSGHSNVLHETGSSFHPDPDTSFHPNHSSASQNAQPPSSDNTCRPPHPPNLFCNIQNHGNTGDTQGSPPYYSEHEGTIRNILRALDILKTEKIFPTEPNIADCIRNSEMNLPDFNIKNALELAIRHQAVIMKKLVNDMPLFVAKDGCLWKCVDTTNSNAKRPKALDVVRKFISSAGGHSAIKNSQSRYEAATILKKLCFQQHALGDVLQILHIVIVRKKWFLPHSSGWQPLSFNTEVVGATRDTIEEVSS